MKIIVVGQVASGKTTIAKELAGKIEGAQFFSTDQFIRDVWSGATSSEELLNIRQQLWDYLGETNVTLPQLRKLAFANPEILKFMENLTREPMKQFVETVLKLNGNIILEYPHFGMIGDTTAEKLSNMIVEVQCDEKVRLERLKARKWSAEEINRVLEAQRSNVNLQHLCDTATYWKIDTTSDYEPYNAQLAVLIGKIRESTCKRDRIGLFAGSFDPVTRGHLAMIAEAASCVDTLYVATAINASKTTMLTKRDILSLLQADVYGLEAKNIIVTSVPEGQSLATFASKLGVSTMFRGIRDSVDLSYERTLLSVTKQLAPQITTCYLLPDPEYLTLSSSFIRGALQLDEWETIISKLVTPSTLAHLKLLPGLNRA